MPEYFHGLSKLDLARAHGVTLGNIDEWIRNGVPYQQGANGKMTFNLAETVRWRMERATGKNALSFERARQAREHADRNAMINAELRGELIRVSHVRDHWAQMISAARAKLLSLPRRLAPIVRMTDTNAKCEAVLEATIYEALEELSNDGVPVKAGKFGRFGNTGSEQGDESGEGGAEVMATATEVDDQPVGRRKKKTKRGGKRRTGRVAH